MASSDEIQGSAYRVDASGATDVGLVRAGNQDAFLVAVGAEAPTGALALLAVADGMGGHKGGEVASAMAVEGLRRGLATAPPSGLADALGPVVVAANDAIFDAAAADPNLLGMGTTLSVVLVIGDRAFLAHVGDSRAYLLKEGSLTQLTSDHTWVQDQIDSGLLKAEDAGQHLLRNVLMRAVGTERSAPVDVTSQALSDGDVLVLCSDGLHSLVDEELIAQIAGTREPEQASRSLVDTANAAGGTDNTTVVVARIVRVSS